MEVHKKIAQKRAPSVCATEAPAANITNQEHHQDDAAQESDSDNYFIMENKVHNNEDNDLTRDHENCTLWIKQPVNWTHFLTYTSFNTNNEDLKKELKTLHGRYIHVDPFKWFRESESAKEERFSPFCIIAGCNLARSDSVAFQESVFLAA